MDGLEFGVSAVIKYAAPHLADAFRVIDSVHGGNTVQMVLVGYDRTRVILSFSEEVRSARLHEVFISSFRGHGWGFNTRRIVNRELRFDDPNSEQVTAIEFSLPVMQTQVGRVLTDEERRSLRGPRPTPDPVARRLKPIEDADRLLETSTFTDEERSEAGAWYLINGPQRPRLPGRSMHTRLMAEGKVTPEMAAMTKEDAERFLADYERKA